MMTASLSLGGSLFVLLVVDICSLPLEKGSNPSTQYRITNVNTADNLASNPRGTLANLTPGLVPYSPQYRGVLVPAYVSSSVSQPTQAGGYTAGSTLTGDSNVGASPGSSNTNTAGNVALTRGGPYAYPSSVVVPYNTRYGGVSVQQPGVYQYAPQSVPVLYTGPSSSGPAQAGGYTTGSTQGGGAARPAAASNVGVSTGGSGANTGANVALSQGGLYPYPSSVAVPYSAPYGGVAVQQPGFSHAAQSVAAPYTGSSYSAPAQAGGSTAGSAQTGATSQPAAEINWAVPPPKLGEESSPNPQSLASGTADEPGALLPPVPAYQPGELSHYEKAAEAGDYQSETEELGHRTVPATMDALAAAGGLASPGFATGQFGMGGLWGSPYPSFDFLFLTGQYPVGTVSHFSQDYEQGRDYSHSTHYLKDHPYPGFAQSVGTVGAAQSLETPSLYVSSPVVGGYYQVGAQTVPASSYTGVSQIKY